MGRKPSQFETFPISFSEATEAGLYRAACENVVDGDTIDVLVDLGLFHYAYVPIRFLNIDTPEIRGTSGTERAAALAAFERTSALLLRQPVLLRTVKDRRSFDRFLGDIFFLAMQDLPDGVVLRDIGGQSWCSIADLLLAEGLATPS